jgi:hypothetical protein
MSRRFALVAVAVQQRRRHSIAQIFLAINGSKRLLFIDRQGADAE